MKLQLVRKTFTDNGTIGELSVDRVFECFTLEDKVRSVKIKGETVNPPGTYEIGVTFSNKFQTFLPLQMNVSKLRRNSHPHRQHSERHARVHPDWTRQRRRLEQQQQAGVRPIV